jgi:hypothetical protein
MTEGNTVKVGQEELEAAFGQNTVRSGSCRRADEGFLR